MGMDRVPVLVGLDYHQNGVPVCVLNRDGDVLMNGRCENDWKRIVRRVSTHGRVYHSGD